jgi:hypothetical protein
VTVKEKPNGLATNGRIGSRWRIGAGWRKPVPTLLLDHVGRKSGNRFTAPLLYLEDGPRLVELYADFESYQVWTEREIPVVILDPR